MELDAKEFREGTTLDTGTCIIGAGPAGLVLAAELVDKRCDVIVIESGGIGRKPKCSRSMLVI